MNEEAEDVNKSRNEAKNANTAVTEGDVPLPGLGSLGITSGSHPPTSNRK